MAVKEVQRFDDPIFLRITYRLRHTCKLPSNGIGGRVDDNTSVLSVGWRVHDDQLDELLYSSPYQLGINGHRGNEIQVAERIVDDDNVNVLPNASSQDMVCHSFPNLLQ